MTWMLSVVIDLMRCLIFLDSLKSVIDRKASVYTGIDFSSHLCILNHGIFLPIKSVALGLGFESVTETLTAYLLILNYPKTVQILK